MSKAKVIADGTGGGGGDSSAILLSSFGPVHLGTGLTTGERTDNTSTLNLALASGKKVLLPAGDLEINGELSADTDNSGLYSNNDCTIWDTRGAGVFFTIHVAADNLLFKDFTIDGGNPQGVYVNGHRGIYGNQTIYTPSVIQGYTRFLTVSGMTIQNYGQDGIRLDYAMDGKFINNTITWCAQHGIMLGAGSFDNLIDGNYVADIRPGDNSSNTAYGITITRDPARDTTDAPISIRNVISNNRVYRVYSWNGIDLHGAQQCQIINNMVTQCSIGIHLEDGNKTTSPVQYVPVRDVLISGNYITGNLGTGFGVGPGINVQGAGLESSSAEWQVNIRVSDNVLRYCGSQTGIYPAGSHGAIHVYGARAIGVTDNNFEQCYGVGVWLDNVNAVLVNGNIFRGMQASGGKQYGVYIADGDCSFSAESNYFFDASPVIGFYAATAADSVNTYKVGTMNSKDGSMTLYGANIPSPV